MPKEEKAPLFADLQACMAGILRPGGAESCRITRMPPAIDSRIPERA
jgi:hypothetical protein